MRLRNTVFLCFIFFFGSCFFIGPALCLDFISLNSSYTNGTCLLLTYTCNVSSEVCSPNSPHPVWAASTNITSLNESEIFLWKGGNTFPGLTGPLLIPRNRTCTTYTVQINETDKEYTCCTDQCDLNPCYNNGTCIPGSDSFQCNCVAGYTGDHCEREQVCEDQPCQNSGSCQSNGTDYTCSCISGYTGKNCELNKINCNSRPCTATGSTCIEGENGTQRRCECKSGFEGNGASCTAVCAAYNTTCTDNTKITFPKNYIDITSYSVQKCENGRSIASVKCISVSNSGLVAFSKSTFTCLPCNEGLSSVNVPIEEATTESVSTAIQVLKLVTTGSATSTQTSEITNLLNNLTEATLTRNITVTNTTISNVLLITENLTPSASTSTAVQDLKDQLVKTVEVFVQALQLPQNSRTITIATEKYVVKVDKPKATGTAPDKPYAAPLSYSLESYQKDNQTNSNVVPQKMKTVSFTISAAILNSLLSRTSLQPGELQVFVVLHQDASLFSNTNDFTTEVVQATASELKFGTLHTLGGDFDLQFENQAQPTVERQALVPSRQKLEIRFQCVFWNYNIRNWSPDGCSLTVQNDDYTCTCNHFTSFALLMHIRDVTEDLQFDLFSLIACSLSLVSLVLTIIIYLAVPDLRRRRPTPILLNISICLSLGYFFFLIGVDKVNDETFCYAVTVILHTTFLCAWFWMLVYSLNMYYALVKVVGGRSPIQKKLFMYLIGYAAPIMIVAVNFIAAIVLDLQNQADKSKVFFDSEYRTKQACWLRSYSFFLGFLAPVSAILLTNVFLFLITIRKLTWKRKQIRSSKEEINVKQQLFMAITLVAMMGLTWTFGYIMMFSSEEIFFTIFSNLFNVFNATQGLVIFLVSCVRQEGVRNMWLVPLLKFFHCNKCLPAAKDKRLMDTSNPSTMSSSRADTNLTSTTSPTTNTTAL